MKPGRGRIGTRDRVEPELSIVIPTHRRAALLLTCLQSLGSQVREADPVEVIVVIDGHDPATEAALEGLTTPFMLRVVVQDHGRQAAARNLGVEHARGRYVLFLDDDVVAAPGLIAAHLDALRTADRVACIGRIEKLLPRHAPRWARSRQDTWRGHYERLAAGREPRFTDCYGGNLSLRRSDFAAVGGFALDLTPEEDIELGYRLAQAGVRLVHAASAVVREQDHDTIRRVTADSRRRGVVGVLLYRRHPELLPQLRLGGAGELGRRSVALRRLLLALRAPPAVVGSAGRLLPSNSLARRWLSFFERYCYWWGVRASVDRDTWRRLGGGTTVLMYHAIGSEGERPSRYVLPGRRFERQLAWLKLRGYNVIGLDEFVSGRLEHRLPPPKSVVLTFDDGYADSVESALPALERHGFPATVFLVSGLDRAGWEPAGSVTADRRLLTSAETRAANGRLTFGSHSRTHPVLTALDQPALDAEVSGSREELEAVLGRSVDHFAYPYGAVDDHVVQAVRKAGYRAAFGVKPGRNRPMVDRYLLQRLEIRGTDSLLRFALMLWLGDFRARRRRLEPGSRSPG